MNYIVIYNKLIESRKKLSRLKGCGVYYESHHIKPSCVGGSDDNHNKVLLTAREHFIAHWLLARAYPEVFELQCAWNAFALTKVGRIRSRSYEYARINFSNAMRTNKERKLKNSITVSNQKWIIKDNVCNRVNRDLAEKLVQNEGWKYGRSSYTRIHSKEHRIKIGLGNKGKFVSEETKKKHSMNGKQKVWINNGVVTRHIDTNSLASFESKGWVRGRLTWK